MKKLAYILIPILLLASADLNRAKLISEILKIIFPNENPTIFIQSKNFKNMKNLSSFKQIEDCQKAEVILVDDMGQIEHCLVNNPTLIATNYKTYAQNSDTIAAIFWQKGRPNLIFRKNQLEKQEIDLPKEYTRYIE